MLAFSRFLTIVLAALAMTMTSAHVLELPQKMAWSADLYSAVNTTLYRYFAIVGGAYQIGAIVSAGLMAALLRRRQVPHRWAATGFALLLLSFASWLVLVQPVNQEVAAALASAPESVPSLWMRVRGRWEYGHAVGFALQLAGFCALVGSVLREVERRGVAPEGRAD